MAFDMLHTVASTFLIAVNTTYGGKGREREAGEREALGSLRTRSYLFGDFAIQLGPLRLAPIR